jgi:hypothetical protein
VAPCRYFVNWRFGGTYRLHLQGIRNPRVMNQREQVAIEYTATCSRWFIARGFLIPWRWWRYIPPKRRFTKYLHGAISKKTAFFIVTAVKTSNLTLYNQLKANRRFGGNQHKAGSKQNAFQADFFFILRQLRLRRYVHSKCHLTFNRLHGQKSS